MYRILIFFTFIFVSFTVEAQKLRIVDPVRILALGDSYTIGQGVTEQERFPAILADSLQKRAYTVDTIVYRALTGWTTSDLLNGIENDPPPSTYNLVTLLAGVNNQYNLLNIDDYAEDFDQLIQIALSYTGSIQNNVMILSIPDYAFTPYGQGIENVSEEIDAFNDINDSLAIRYGIPYVNITDISRRGLDEPELVAVDELHPSGLQYSLWVERILENVETSFIVTGVNPDQEKALKIYPNPVKEFMNVESTGSAEFRLYTYYGQEILRQEFEYMAQVDLRNLSSGIYFGIVEGGGFSYQKIVIKE
jgi:lysophospholipase L1-like esterase